MCFACFSSSVNVLLGLQIGHWINFCLFLSLGWGTWWSVWMTSAITWSLAMIVASRFAVVALAEKVTSSSSGNRIPQSWSDLGEIISSFSTEGPVKGPEMGRWTPPLVWIRLCSKSLSVIRSPFTKVYRKSNRGIWFSSSAISSFRGSTLGETEGRRQKITKEEKRVKSTHRSIQIFQSSEKGQSTREIASCKTKYNESRLVKRSSHPIQN